MRRNQTEAYCRQQNLAYMSKDPDLKRELLTGQLLLGTFHVSISNLVTQILEDSRLTVFDHLYHPKSVFGYRFYNHVRAKVVLLENRHWHWPRFSLIERGDSTFLEQMSGDASVKLANHHVAQRFQFFVERQSVDWAASFLDAEIAAFFRTPFKKRVKGEGSYLLTAFVPERSLDEPQQDIVTGMRIGTMMHNAFKNV